MKDKEQQYPMAIQFCERIRNSVLYIRQSRDEIAELEDYSRSISAMNYARISGGKRNDRSGATFEGTLARIDKLQRQYIDQMKVYLSERERAMGLFDKLPPRIGEAFRLRYLHNKDNSYILNRCGISRNTLPVWFRQGFALLEQLLADDGSRPLSSDCRDTANDKPDDLR